MIILTLEETARQKSEETEQIFSSPKQKNTTAVCNIMKPAFSVFFLEIASEHDESTSAIRKQSN